MAPFILIAVLAAMTFSATAAFAQEALGPQNFQVNVDVTPNVAVPVITQQTAGQYCVMTGPPVGTVPCNDIPVSVSAATDPSKGTVNQIGAARSGQFELVCDFNVPTLVDVDAVFGPNFIPSEIGLRDITGSGPIDCSWAMDFGKDGILAGTVSGTMTLSRVEGQQKLAVTIPLDVSVVAGSGFFERAAGGTGSLVVYHEEPWTGKASSSSRTRMAAEVAAAPPNEGAMALTVKSGKRRARIVPLKGEIAKGDKRKLRVVAAARSTCKATAKLGKKKVSLGKAADKDRNAEIRFGGTLATKLNEKGTWKVGASCSYRKGGKTTRLPTATMNVKRA